MVNSRGDGGGEVMAESDASDQEKQPDTDQGPLRLEDLFVLRGANHFSWDPVVVARLQLGPYDEVFTCDIAGFRERLEACLPSLVEHQCSEGVRGGFFLRVEGGTLLGHVTEHVALELQNLAGMDVAFGKTRWTGEPGAYYVVFRYEDEACGLAAARLAVDLVNGCLRGERGGTLQRERAVEELKALLAGRVDGVGLELVREARRRDLPVIVTEEEILLGRGRGLVKAGRMGLEVGGGESVGAWGEISQVGRTSKILGRGVAGLGCSGVDLGMERAGCPPHPRAVGESGLMALVGQRSLVGLGGQGGQGSEAGSPGASAGQTPFVAGRPLREAIGRWLDQQFGPGTPALGRIHGVAGEPSQSLGDSQDSAESVFSGGGGPRSAELARVWLASALAADAPAGSVRHLRAEQWDQMAELYHDDSWTDTVVEVPFEYLMDEGLPYGLAESGMILSSRGLRNGRRVRLRDPGDWPYCQAVVLEEVKGSGVAVLNADDEAAWDQGRRVLARKVFFSRNGKLRFFAEHIAGGHPGILVTGDDIELRQWREVRSLGSWEDYGLTDPSSQDGLLGVMGVLVGLGWPAWKVRAVLRGVVGE